MTSFSEDMRRRGMEPGSRTLSLERELAGARLGRALQVSPAEKILVIKRLRLADGAPMAIETLHLPERLVPGLGPRDLDNGSFYDLLGDRFGIHVAEGRRSRRRSASRSTRRPSSSSGRAATKRGAPSSSCSRCTGATATGSSPS
jgi:DNA-binding GntR family transcriptional regulator